MGTNSSGDYKRFNIETRLSEIVSEAPLKSYNWYVILPDITTDTNPELGGDGEIYTSQYSAAYKHITKEMLSTRVTNLTTPFITVETKKTAHQNSYWYTARRNDIGDITMEIEEMEDGSTIHYLRAWMGKMMNPNGTYNPPKHYKRDIIVFKVDDQKYQVQKFVYKGYFISSIEDMSSDYENNGFAKYSVKLTGDSYTVNSYKVPHDFYDTEDKLKRSLGELVNEIFGSEYDRTRKVFG